jgi:hypothetical protein
LLSRLLISPPVSTGEQVELPELILPRETTMIMAPTMPPGVLLRGQVRLVADTMGTAPVGGQVARQIVEPGAHVKKGDTVIEISTGQSERAAPAAENRQNEAERSQIAASNAQNALAQKISIAQSSLRAAQERVERAQNQVSSARDIVRRLQNGEAVSSSEIPAPFRSAAVKPVKKRRIAKAAATAAPVDRSGEIALQQAEAAREAANQGNQGLKMARQMLADAQKGARDAADRLKASTKKVTDTEARFDEKKATGADVEDARASQREAQTVATAAERAVTSALAEVSKREKAVGSLQKYADKAAADAKAALKNVRLFPAEESEPEAEATSAPEDGARPTLGQAIQFANAALDESRRASREAEKLHSEVESYQRQVSNSNARIASTTEDLQSAQQRVLDSVPRARFTAAVAPAEGIVTWVSRLAREVGAGQSIFGIARGDKMGARFEDKGDLWRSVKPGSILPAVASNATVKSATSGSSATSTPSSSPPSSSAPSALSSPVEIRVTEVQPPQNPGDAAVVNGEIRTSGQGAAVPSLGEGTVVMASIPRPGQKPTLSVPNSALIKKKDQIFVAVLSPNAPVNAPVPSSDSAPSDAKVGAAPTEPKATSETEFRLEWKLVQLGRDDGFRHEVLSGLQTGDCIVAMPAQLQEMGFSPEPLASAGVSEGQLPQEVSPAPVVVRLTPASA